LDAPSNAKMANKVTQYKGQVTLRTILLSVVVCFAAWLGLFVAPWVVSSAFFDGPAFLLAYGVIFCAVFWRLGAPLLLLPVHIYDVLNSNPNNQARINKVDAAYRQLLTLVETLALHKGPCVSGLLARLAQTQLSRGNYERASYYYDKALENLTKQKHGKHHEYTMAILKNNRGVAYLGDERYVEAELDGTEAMEYLQALSKKDPKTYSPTMLAAPLTILGTARLRLGELSAAENYYREALVHIDHPDAFRNANPVLAARSRACFELTMALIKVRLGQVEEATTLTGKALDVLELEAEELDPQTLVGLGQLAEEWIARNELVQAERILKIGYAVGKVCPFHRENRRIIDAYTKLLRLSGRDGDVELMQQWLLE